MKRRYTVLFALVASFLVVSAVPVGAASTSLAVGSSHTTASDFNNATTLNNVEVQGSGESAVVALKESTTIDSAEDGDLSEYASTSDWTASTAASYHGSWSIAKDVDVSSSSESSRAFTSTSGLPEYPEQGDTFSVRMKASNGQGFHGFLFGTQQETSNQDNIDGYLIQLDHENGDLSIWKKTSSNGYNTLTETSVAMGSSEWYEVKVDWATDGTITATLYDSNGNQIAQTSATDTTWSSGGIGYRFDAKDFGNTYYYDYVVEGTAPETGQYVGAPHDVDNAKKGWVDLNLNNAEATITWEAYDGSSWVPVNSTTVSSSGNYTLSIGGTSYDRFRANVEFNRTGTSYTAEVEDEGVLFDPRTPTADGASATPSGGSETNDEDVTLSVPVSDADFGTSQGDSVTVDFYVDGNLTDTQTITSNQTVSTTATELADGDHTWHVELADEYGETSTSSTWNFTVNHYAPVVDDASASPQGGQQFNDENIEASVNVSDRDFDESSGDTVTVDFYVDGAVVDSTTISSNQTVTFNANNLGDGNHTWHVETSDEYGLTSSSSTYNFEVLHYAAEIDNANATPQDDAQKTARTITLSAPVNDSDFAETSGDEIAVEFYLDGSLVDTVNMTANGTASTTVTISEGGSKTWHVETVDEYGLTSESDADPNTAGAQPFSFFAPSELRIYNESAPNTLVDEVTVEIQFYGGADGDAFTVQRSTDDGVINMSGLPADKEFIVVVNSEGYHNRRVYVESLYEQASVFLLPTSENAVYNVFKIDDKSGAYPPGETRIIIQRALNRSGNFTWRTVSGDVFGSTNEHKTYLRYNVRYRLIVENDQGQRRMMGPYFATDENNPKIITVSSIVVSPPEGQAYYGTSYIEDETEDDGQKTLRFTYTDPEELTDSLDLVIHERGNESNVLANISTDNVGDKWAYSTVLDENESAKSWVVDWQGQRDGEEIGAMVPVGNRGGLPLPMSQEWLTRFGLIALVVVASLSSERMATIGAMGTVAFAGILMITGIWPIPVVLWFAALIISVGGHALTKAQRGGVVG